MAIPSRRVFYEACERYDEKCKVTGNPTIAEIVEKMDRRRIYRRRDELVDKANARPSWVDEDPFFCGDPTQRRPSWLRRLLGRVGL